MIDHPPLDFSRDWLEAYNTQFDNELYGIMKCQDCDKVFQQIFTLTPTQYDKK